MPHIVNFTLWKLCIFVFLSCVLGHSYLKSVKLWDLASKVGWGTTAAFTLGLIVLLCPVNYESVSPAL